MIALLINLIVGLFFLLGTFISLYTKNKKNLISFSVGISFTVLILLVFIDILPESLELFNTNKELKIILGITIGLGILFILDKFIPHHHDNKKSDNLIHIGVMTSIALIIHNIIEGAGIYSVIQTSLKGGLIYAFGVTLHNIPFGIKITAMLKNNLIKMKIYLLLLIISPFLGGLLIHTFNRFLADEVIGFILSITIGLIIYIVVFELLNLLKNNFNKYVISGILIGITLMLVGMVI